MQTNSIGTNQESGGLVSVLTEPLAERDLDFCHLDRTVDRYQLLLLAKRVGKQAGFTPRMLQLLEYYLAYTTAKDWEEGSRPIVFQSLARTAMDLGVGERQIQKLEKRLFDIGAICWNDSGNHKRYGRRDPKSGRLIFAYGVDLTPLAYLQEQLVAKLHEKQLYSEAWRSTKREISETRRQIRERLRQLREEGGDATMLARHEANYREIAYELRSHINLARLRELNRHHAALHDELTNTLYAMISVRPDQQAASSPIAPATRIRSRSHAQKVAHQEQTTPKKKREGPSASDDDGGRESSEHGEAIGKQMPQRLASQSTAALKACLPVTGQPTTWKDLVVAAHRRRTELNISQASWAAACGSLGRRGAAICLLLTDDATSRSLAPVSKPASYFKILVGRSLRGDLDLQGSLSLR